MESKRHAKIRVDNLSLGFGGVRALPNPASDNAICRLSILCHMPYCIKNQCVSYGTIDGRVDFALTHKPAAPIVRPQKRGA